MFTNFRKTKHRTIALVKRIGIFYQNCQAFS